MPDAVLIRLNADVEEAVRNAGLESEVGGGLHAEVTESTEPATAIRSPARTPLARMALKGGDSGAQKRRGFGEVGFVGDGRDGVGGASTSSA